MENYLKTNYVVYAILDINGSYFYIGKGQKKRLSATLSARNNTPLKRNKIISIKNKTGKNPKIKILCIGSEEYCFDIEKKLIKYYGKKIDNTGSLCNISDGGEGTSGIILSEERKKQISNFFKNNNPMQKLEYREKVRLSKLGEKNPMFRKSHSLESRQKISIANSGNNHYNYGNHLSEQTKNKISLGNKGRKHSWTNQKRCEEHIEKLRASRCKTKFKIINPNNIIIETFYLSKFCKENNLNTGHMYQVVKGNLKSYKGWRVEYV